MRELEELKVSYIGYSDPKTEEEVSVEIAGLELAIKCAERRVALLKQGVMIARAKAVGSKETPKSEEKPQETK